MPRRSARCVIALALVAAPAAVVPSGASAASGKQRACYTATTFRAVSGPSACRGAEAYITWAKHGLNGLSSITGGAKPKVAPGITGDSGAHGPFIATRPVRALRGAAGLRGVTGDSGPQGPKGEPGAPGDPGAPGEAGPQGLRGVNGETGPRGLEGPQGDKGAQGDQGEQGAQGLEGLTGAAGPAGLSGLPGTDGAQGPQGVPGANGANGADGAPGLNGPPGLDGAPGQSGTAGPPGPQGPAGPAGNPGPVGPPGRAPSGFRRTLVGSVPLDVTPLAIAVVTPAAGSYMGGATTTVTATPVAATVVCSVTDGTTVLGQTTALVGSDQATPSSPVSVQLGVFTANGTPLTFSCASDAPGVAVASNTVFAGLSLDAIAETP